MNKGYLLLFFLFVYAKATPIYFKHIGMKEGLAQLAVMTIYQDELGRMWFGTEEGLSVYNGSTTTSYKPTYSLDKNSSNGFPGNNINSITGDERGNLYFMSDYSALFHFDLRTERFEKLIPENIKTIFYHENQLWIGINDSICIWNSESKSYDFKLKLEGKIIQKLFFNSENQLWIGTKNGLFLYEKETIQEVIKEEDIYELFEDSQKNMWIATRENGMYKQNTKGVLQKFVHDPLNSNSLSSNHIRCFAEDTKGQIWIGTFLGLNLYNPKSEEFTVYSKDIIPGSLAHSSVFSIFKDRQGSLWVGTYYGGVHYFNPETDIFTYYYADNFRSDCISNPFVGHMIEDKNGNIWICTEGGGLNFFDRKKRQFTHYMSNQTPNSIAHNNLKSICYSSERNKLYIGTHTGGLSIYDISRKEFKNIKNTFPENKPELADDVINQVGLYKNKYLIFFTRRGILKMSLDDEKISSLFSDNYVANSFLIDSKNNIWLGQGSSVRRINLDNEQDQSKYDLPSYGVKLYSIIKIFEDNQGRIYMGTRGSGLFEFNEKEQAFMRYTVEEDLMQSNYCYDIIQTKRGALLLSGDKGLSYFFPESKRTTAIALGTALPISGINYGCGMLICEDGEIFVGGVDGLTSFYEEALLLPPKKYNLYFSSLSVNNELVHPCPHSTIIKTSLPYTKEITLKSNENNLIFTFTTNNYVSTLETPLYEYKMEGFDEKWILNTDQKISYTNLSPGKYTLLVREKQNDSSPPIEPLRLEVRVKSPFYATPFAIIFYIIVFVGVIVQYSRFRQTKVVLSTSLEFERKEKERIKVLNQEKLQFFSNISHEFRTPLTLIMSQVELLLQSSRLDPFLYNKLLKVYKNSSHMRNLITELLDFRKLEQGFLTLKVSNENIVAFIKEIYLSFFDVAQRKNISYQFHSDQDQTDCWIDPRQMQKAISNLLANAFKYTDLNGIIDVVIEEDEESITVKIIDNGIGIEKEEIDKIFNRFYQSSNEINNNPSLGSGIGLSLSKGIVELHHGSLLVESKPGYGSVFSIRLKKGRAHFKEREVCLVETAIIEDVKSILVELDEDEDKEQNQNEGKIANKILIIEDNNELLQVLVTLFSPIYDVSTAQDGKEGLAKAVEIMPDIILSDIMMPLMSGTDLCLQIKNNFNLCHIPVVLLTALTSHEHHMEGFKLGADAYITKPFNARLLLARCNNIVRNRILLKQKYTKQDFPDTNLLAGNSIDQEFLELINKTIVENMANFEFDMNALARELNISRSSFYAKFKGLTGMTPNDYVMNFKLKVAAKWLKEKPTMNIAEIADHVGFNSARYFTQCFKKQFHTTPARYRTQTDE